MPRYFACPDDQPFSDQFAHLGYFRCGTQDGAWQSLTEQDLVAMFSDAANQAPITFSDLIQYIQPEELATIWLWGFGSIIIPWAITYGGFWAQKVIKQL